MKAVFKFRSYIEAVQVYESIMRLIRASDPWLRTPIRHGRVILIGTGYAFRIAAGTESDSELRNCNRVDIYSATGNNRWSITRDGINYSGTSKGFSVGCKVVKPSAYGVIVRATVPISYRGDWVILVDEAGMKHLPWWYDREQVQQKIQEAKGL